MTEGYILSVTQLNEYVNSLIRNDVLLGSVSIRGEISGLKRHTSGHVYFSLKDDSALVRCVMFRQNAISMPAGITDGMQVVVSGYASIYTKDGQFQFYVKSMSREGEGELYRRFLMLKTRLAAQGLFDENHKKPIPMLPNCVGVVTSKTGAALQDIINIIRRRFPMMDILVSPASVQGIGAAKEIADAIRLIDSSDKADVLIVGRGGGSIEDLWAFNEEVVARAIYECRTPVISAVGHETDFTIADFTADLRAPTPSAAAELCVPEYEALSESLEYVSERMLSLCTDRIEREEKAIAVLEQGTARNACAQELSLKEAELNSLMMGISSAVRQSVSGAEHTLALNSARLDSLAPSRTLERGYAIIKKGKKYVSSVSNLTAGDDIGILLSDGTAGANVTFAGKEGK